MRPLLILALVVVLGYAISHLLFPRRRVSPMSRQQAPGTVAEEMVRDPFCHLYLPRSEAIRQSIRGQNYYFCSPGCVEKFLALRS
jgi:YHS domain-containing protein